MKKRMRALVRIDVVATAAAALVLAAATPAAHAALPVAKLKASAWLTQSSTAQGTVTDVKFHVTTTFSTDTPGAQPFTIQKAVVFFPDHAGTNGRLFPSCSAKQIERFDGNIRRCPKGSKLGGGTVTARVPELGITATGRVTMFNSHRGTSITFNIQTLHPAAINESIDAPLTQLHGKYGEKLTLVVPHSLQEVLPDIFVAVEKFDVTIGGTVLVHGVSHRFLKARTCPTVPMHGVFDLADWTTGATATTTADATVHCSIR